MPSLTTFAVALIALVSVGATTLEPAPFGAIPTTRQLRWHEMEMYGLIHFGLNTFQNKEWGYGDAEPTLFNPTQFDAEQIVLAAKTGGLKGLIIVAKHHDGFALWPTGTTDYNISRSSWRNGEGDVVRAFQQACARHGLRLGVYCSPWDRNNKDYGSPAYLKIYREQLRELYSNYGELFVSWHDGANGGDGYYGGAREKRMIDRTTYYDWATTWEMTRRLQPGAVIFSDIGPDVRWVGNEKGFAAETSWATFAPVAPDGVGRAAPGYSKDEEAPGGHANAKTWIPAECDVPLRKGWFYHADQDSTVKTAIQLYDIYLKSVGRGADLDLGLAPDTRGLLHERDVVALQEFGELLRRTFSHNLARGAKLQASNVRGNDERSSGPARLVDDDRYTHWATDDEVTTAELTVEFAKPATFRVVRLRENIKLGQRIEALALDAWSGSGWSEIAQATSIGANRLIRLDSNVTASKVRLRITRSRASIVLSDLGLYAEP
jgi:alpha-L-fucosidase